MKKIQKLIIFYLLSFNIFSTSLEVKYRDISSEHWAYKSIQNLTQKGILDISSEIFNGERTINRFDLAYFLSKTLDRVENDKADRADLIILEHIVYEFSEELSKFGFDTKTYLLKVDSFESRIEENRIFMEGAKADIIKLDNRIKLIERENSRKNQFFNQGENFVDSKLEFLNDFNFYLKANVDYKLNESTDKNSFKGAHQLGLAIKRPNYELFLESETSDKERKRGELLIKGQMSNEIIPGYTLNFHTADYERYFKSHFNNVIYDNHNSYRYIESGKEYQHDSFDSYGIALANENMAFLVEKTRSDYDNVYVSTNQVQGVTVDNDFSDTFNFIGKFDYKYFQALLLKNINNSNLDLELTAKYPVKNFEVAGAISQKSGSKRSIVGEFNNSDLTNYDTLRFLNGEMVYGGKSNFTLGLESKFNEEDKLYTAYYTSYKYNLTDRGKIKYKYEFINRDKKKDREDFQNHYFVVNIFGEKINTYFSYNIINLNKKYYLSNTQNNNYYKNEIDYNELLLKSTYKFNEKALAKVGYTIRRYEEESKEDKEITFVQGQYNINTNAYFFVKYIKNTSDGDFNDRRLDVDNNMIDLDFDNRTGVLRSAPEGRIEVGIELVF